MKPAPLPPPNLKIMGPQPPEPGHHPPDDVAFGFVLGMIVAFALFTAFSQMGVICGF